MTQRASNSKDLVPWWHKDISEDEIGSIRDAIIDHRITQGPVTESFERHLGDILGMQHVIVTNNGASALAVALLSVGVGPGDEVIVPGSTFIATAHAVMLLGAKAVPVDTRASLPLMNVGLVESAITPKTRAVIPVHVNGRSVDMQSLRGVAQKHGLIVIEDAAQAFGSSNRNGLLGTQSDIGCFSFGITKLIATGEGGACVTNDDTIAHRLRMARNNGAVKLVDNRFESFGFNFRITDMQSAMGLAQLQKIDIYKSGLHQVYNLYLDALTDLRNIHLLPVDLATGELPLWIEALCSDPGKLIAWLVERQIQAKPYPPALCDIPTLRCDVNHPRSRFFAHHTVILPSGPDQSVTNLNRTIEALLEFDAGPGQDLPPLEIPEG